MLHDRVGRPEVNGAELCGSAFHAAAGLFFDEAGIPGVRLGRAAGLHGPFRVLADVEAVVSQDVDIDELRVHPDRMGCL